MAPMQSLGLPRCACNDVLGMVGGNVWRRLCKYRIAAFRLQWRDEKTCTKKALAL